jgi:hypothetical protein
LSFSFNIDEIGIEDTASILEVLAFIVIANSKISYSREDISLRRLMLIMLTKKITRIACVKFQTTFCRQT